MKRFDDLKERQCPNPAKRNPSMAERYPLTEGN